MNPLIKVENLSIDYFSKNEYFRAIDNISFEINKNKIVGIAGESGSGKSSLALSILNLTQFLGAKIKGKILFDKKNLIKSSEKSLRKIRGKEISIIFQNSWDVLDPIFTIKNQFQEYIKAHYKKISIQEINKIITYSLKLSQLPSNKNFLNLYPRQLSGGMLQRVSIAMAIALKPKLLIADEPTSSLDVINQKKIIDLLKKIGQKKNMSIIFISHDLALISQLCNDIIIIKNGKLIEKSSTKNIFQKPNHNYTKKLIQSIPIIKFNPLISPPIK
jgi:ABC-type dipeptide/oligopeptide/nickel transport system ATPase component